MKTKLLLAGMFLFATLFVNAQTVTDFDGNVYDVVTIGTQNWMQQNLKALHYADGTSIVEVYAFQDNAENVEVYGRLYTWNAAMKNLNVEMAQGACPSGWHLPTIAEYDALISFLGGESVAGGKMKEAGTDHWESPNTGADNSSSFTALPGGFYVGEASMYVGLGQMGKFWTSNDVNGIAGGAYHADLNYDETTIDPECGNVITSRISIRCIEGQGVVGINQNIKNKEFKVYPNPVTDMIVVSLSKNSDVIQADLLDVNGKLVDRFNLTKIQTNISLSGLVKGVYFLKITSDNNSQIEKIVKM